MKRKKIIGFFSVVVTVAIVGVGIIFNDFNVQAKEDNNIKTIDTLSMESPVYESIHNLLEQFFWMELSPNEEDCSNIVSDKKLAEVYNLMFENLRELNKTKENKKLEVNISNIQEVDNKYIVNFEVSKEFICSGNTETSFAKDFYTAEIINKDNKLYINKLVDYFDYVQTLEENLPVVETRNNKGENIVPSDVLNGNEYKSILDTKMFNLEEYEKKKEEINDKLKTQKEDTGYKEINARYNGYDWRSAVVYAEKWANDYNPAFTRYSSDCQNFVSQCVYNGSVPMTRYWHHYVNSDYSLDVTKSWSSVTHFYDYIKDNGYTWGNDYYYDWRLGDVVQMYNPKLGKYSHSVILTGTHYDGTPLYSAHTIPRLDHPLVDGLASGKFSDWRYIKFWH